jgi:hypothetical protein
VEISARELRAGTVVCKARARDYIGFSASAPVLPQSEFIMPELANLELTVEVEAASSGLEKDSVAAIEEFWKDEAWPSLEAAVEHIHPKSFAGRAVSPYRVRTEMGNSHRRHSCKFALYWVESHETDLSRITPLLSHVIGQLTAVLVGDYEVYPREDLPEENLIRPWLAELSRQADAGVDKIRLNLVTHHGEQSATYRLHECRDVLRRVVSRPWGAAMRTALVAAPHEVLASMVPKPAVAEGADAAAEVAHAVRLALATGATETARDLAREGSQRHPANAELGALARLLAPPRVLEGEIPPQPGTRANQEWLRAHSAEHGGSWVALRDGELVASARSLREVREAATDSRDLFITRVA